MMRHQLFRSAARASALSAGRTGLAAPAWQQAVRQYSIAPAASETKLADIDPSQLVIERTTNPKPLKAAKDLIFGRNFTGRSMTPISVTLDTGS